MHSIPETRIEVDAPRDIGGSILATIYTARIRNTDANSSFSSRMETASAGKAFSRYVSAFIAQRFDSSLFFSFFAAENSIDLLEKFINRRLPVSNPLPFPRLVSFKSENYFHRWYPLTEN